MKDKWPFSYNYKINYSLYFSLQAIKFSMFVTAHTWETLKLTSCWKIHFTMLRLCFTQKLKSPPLPATLPPKEKQTSIRHVLKPIEMVSFAVISCERQGNMMSRKSRFSVTSSFAIVNPVFRPDKDTHHKNFQTTNSSGSRGLPASCPQVARAHWGI